MTPDPGARPPVRIVHLGLGGFFRAHQARYTGAAPDAAAWAIAAFTEWVLSGDFPAGRPGWEAAAN